MLLLPRAALQEKKKKRKSVGSRETVTIDLVYKSRSISRQQDSVVTPGDPEMVAKGGRVPPSRSVSRRGDLVSIEVGCARVPTIPYPAVGLSVSFLVSFFGVARVT